MPRLPGTLLLVLSLLPLIAAGGEALGTPQRDGRDGAVASNVDHFNLAEPGTPKRVLDGGSGGGIGHSPWSGRAAPSVPRPDSRTLAGILPPHPAYACRPFSERLPYHATAPPLSHGKARTI